MDAIEPGFRPLYGKVCVGNKRADAQDVFFEGMLLEEGMGKYGLFSSITLISWTYLLTRSTTGEGQSWHGKSSWGHPDFNRKSVCLSV